MENVLKALSEYTLFGPGEQLFENSKRHKDKAYLIDIVVSAKEVNLLYALNGELVKETFIVYKKQHRHLLTMSSNNDLHTHQDILNKWTIDKGDYKNEIEFLDLVLLLMKIERNYVVGCFIHEQSPLHNLFFYMETNFNTCSINVVGINGDTSRILQFVKETPKEIRGTLRGMSSYIGFLGFWNTLKRRVLTA